MSEETTLIVKKLAGARDGEEPPAKRVRAARIGLLRAIGGLIVAVGAMAIAWTQGLGQFPVLALCLTTATFAAGIMDSDTLVKLVQIVFRKEKGK